MNDLATAVGAALGTDVVGSAPLSGGDTAAAFRLELADGRSVFAKTHSAPPPGFFSREASDLGWLAAAAAVPVPRVLAVGDDDPPMLVLEWIEPGGPTADDAAFGRSLAALHRAGAESFGRRDGRTTGSLGLPNEPGGAWSDFYATCRLFPLARLASDRGALGRVDIVRIERVAGRLDEIGGPAEPPARLHGDLWAGNRMIDADGVSWLIDPAAHGGHREFDLAMMRLFGGYGASAFDLYDEVHPLADGWQHRIALHQLAPLIVHAIKFGGGYVASVSDALDDFD